MGAIYRIVMFVRKLVLLSTILFILYHLMLHPVSLDYFFANILDIFQLVKGEFLFGAATLLIMAAGFMALFQQPQYSVKFLIASIILIILAGYAGFTPDPPS